MSKQKLKYNFLMLILSLAVMNTYAAGPFDKQEVIKSLNDPYQRYGALERLEGVSLDEDLYKEVEKILSTKEEALGTIIKARKLIIEDKNASLSKKVKTFSNALKNQIENPELTYDEGFYTPRSEAYKRQFIFVFEEMGPKAIPYLKEELKMAKGKHKDYINIILADLKEAKVYEEVVAILKNSDDGWIRASAARSLGLLGDKRAIPLLEAALNDLFEVDKTRTGADVLGPPGSDMNIIYPVREEAASALKLLGIRVERLGHKFWIKK